MDKTFFIKIAALIFSLSMFMPSLANGVPTGHFEFFFSEPRLYGISNTVNESIGPFDVNFTVILDEKGKITGSGFATIDGDSDNLDSDVRVAGKIKAAKNVTRFNLILKLKGVVTVDEQSLPFKGIFNSKLEISNATSTAIGIIKIKLCVKGFGCEKLVENFSVPLPGLNGSWMLSLDLLDAGNNKIVGDGLITLSNDREISTKISGKYSSEIIKLKLKNSSGSKLGLTSTVNGMMLDSINKISGKVLGQKLKLDN